MAELEAAARAAEAAAARDAQRSKEAVAALDKERSKKEAVKELMRHSEELQASGTGGGRGVCCEWLQSAVAAKRGEKMVCKESWQGAQLPAFACECLGVS